MRRTISINEAPVAPAPPATSSADAVGGLRLDPDWRPPAAGLDAPGDGIAACLMAISAHAAALALFLVAPAVGPLGTGGVELEGLGVDIVSSEVLDTRDRMGRAVTAARTPLELHSKQGSDETSQPSAPSPDQQLSPKPEDVVEAPPPTATVVARPDPDERPNEQELVLPVAPEVGPQTPETTEQPVPLTVAAERTEAREQSVPSVAAEAAEAGGATAQGLAPTAAMEPAAAQGGETTLQLSEYARSVVETLSRRKPRISGGQRGTVRIEFAIGLNGEVVSARILTSSGYASLDQAALAAVRGTQFAKPPPGSGAGDVRYAIPFYFR